MLFSLTEEPKGAHAQVDGSGPFAGKLPYPPRRVEFGQLHLEEAIHGRDIALGKDKIPNVSGIDVSHSFIVAVYAHRFGETVNCQRCIRVVSI